MLRVAILDDYQRIAQGLADWQGLGPDCEVVSFDRHIGAVDETAQALADFDVLCLMRERMTLTRAHFAALPRLKLVVVTGGRVRCIDTEAARDNGVAVCLTGGTGVDGPVELTLGLILALARRIPQEDRAMRAGGWQEGLGMLLAGRTLGILGLGRIGQQIAAFGAMLGMRIVAWSPNLTPERAAEAGATLMSRERFLAESDVITLHMVLSERTRHLIGAAELALMKPGALVVNTSRGGLIDQDALVAALRDGRIGGAALDVYDTEPLPPDHPLRGLPNTVLTPHIGYVTDSAYRTHYARCCTVIDDWRAGRPLTLLT